ncbi:MAG: hypothetical protein QXY47_05325 [Thermoplasmata archaeon]
MIKKINFDPKKFKKTKDQKKLEKALGYYEKSYKIEFRSDCCRAKMRVKCAEDFGYDKKGVTCHYECEKCGKPCDPIQVEVKK